MSLLRIDTIDDFEPLAYCNYITTSGSKMSIPIIDSQIEGMILFEEAYDSNIPLLKIVHTKNIETVILCNRFENIITIEHDFHIKTFICCMIKYQAKESGILPIPKDINSINFDII
jgi:hypothetical protein